MVTKIFWKIFSKTDTFKKRISMVGAKALRVQTKDLTEL